MCELVTFLASYKGLQMQYVSSVPVYAWVTIPPRIGLHVYIIKLKLLLVVKRIVLWHIFSYG